MKIFASLMTLVLVLHCACIGRCLGQQSSAQPPCHHQKDTPKQDSSLCSEGSALAAKTAPVLKCTMDWAAVPGVAELGPTLTHAWHTDSARLFETNSPPLLRPAVLRI